MKWFLNSLVLCFVVYSRFCFCEISDDWPLKSPTIGISILVRNKAHSLPFFFSCLEDQIYPKQRIYIWIYTDYNVDESSEIIRVWMKHYGAKYKSVFFTDNITSGAMHSDESVPTQWTKKRYQHVIRLREKALEFARDKWADFHLMLDADVYLTNPYALRLLTRKNGTLVAPMLLTDGPYSNFWGGMNQDFYYERTEIYETIRTGVELGCFKVPMIHTAVMMNMRYHDVDYLTYDPNKLPEYEGPEDDIITFAKSAEARGIAMFVCNDEHYGYIQEPVEEQHTLDKEYMNALSLRLFAIGQGNIFPLKLPFERFVDYPPLSKFGCDEIYMINLRRRPERRQRMIHSFREIGIDVKIIDAIDGMEIDIENINSYNIILLKHYEDPYHKRPMKAGEIGCFLSHYYIWKEVAERNLSQVMILEDDVRFEPFFRRKYPEIQREMDEIEWDLIYLGRKALASDERRVSSSLVRAGYSYWTLAYIINARGAQKLLDADPLHKMLPVDEFLPIMFDAHPNELWKLQFENRNLNAYSAVPLLVQPTHYTGQYGYISDTEDSSIVYYGEQEQQGPTNNTFVEDQYEEEELHHHLYTEL